MKKTSLLLAFLFAFLVLSSVGHAFNPALFNYRVPIELTTSPANVTNINIWLNVTYRTGMDADFNNLRFTWLNTTSEQEQEIPFWKESYVAGKYAIIWLKVPQINGTVYMYYDNVTTLPADVLANNGSETFLAYYPLNSLAGLGTYVGTDCKYLGINTVKFGYGVLQMNISAAGGIPTEWCWVYMNSTSLPSGFKIDVDTYSNNIMDVFAYLTDINDYGYIGRFDARNPPPGYNWYDLMYLRNYGLIDLTNIVSPQDVWLHMQLIRYPNGTWILAKGGSLTDIGTVEISAYNVSKTSGGWGLSGDGATGVTYFKNLFIESITDQAIAQNILNAEVLNTLVTTNVENKTYYGSNIPVSFNASSSFAYNCTLYLNGNEIAEINQSTNYTATKVLPDGFYNFTYYCINTLGVTNTKSIYFYVWDGVNLTAILNDTGEKLAWFNLSATNGTTTVNFANTTGLIEYNKLPQGNVEFTLDDAHANLYYYPAVFNLTINSTNYYVKDVYLKPKPSNEITLSSSAGWSMTTGGTTVLNCYVSQGTPNLFINSIKVAVPYSFTPEVGTYYVTCSVPETPLYKPTNASKTLLVNPVFGCVNNKTFAFKKTFTVTATGLYTINMTKIVKDGYAKSDLSDVVAFNVSNIWINTTKGEYLIVNATNLTFTIEFGNYIVNKSYPNHDLTADVLQISIFEQIHPYVIGYLRDEMTNQPLYPPNSTVYLIADCPTGENFIKINYGDTKFLIPSNTYLTKATIRVQYTADAYYSRSLLLKPYEAQAVNFYVVDAFKHALDRVEFVMTDINHYDSILVLYKKIDNQTIVITEGRFDQAHQYSAYLVEDSEYNMELINPDGTITQLGTVTIYEPCTKDIGVNVFTFNPTSVNVFNTIKMDAYYSDNDTILNIYYLDKDNETKALSINVYFTNGTIYKSFNYTNIPQVELKLNVSEYINTSFYVMFNATTQKFGNVKQSIQVIKANAININVSPLWLNLFALGIIVLVAGITTTRNLIGGSIGTIATVLFMKAIGWLMISAKFLVFIIFVIMLGIIVQHKKEQVFI